MFGIDKLYVYLLLLKACDFERKRGAGASFACLFTVCVLASRDGAGDEEAGPNMQKTTYSKSVKTQVKEKM